MRIGKYEKIVIANNIFVNANMLC